MKFALIKNLFILILFTISTFAAPADFDKTFSADGKVTTTMGIGAAEIFKTIVQADGKIVAAGYAQNAGSATRQFALARYNTDGSLDFGFGVNGKVFTTISGGNAYAYDIAIQSNGRIVVVGLLDTGSRYQSVIVRYKANGSLAGDFDGDTANDIAVFRPSTGVWYFLRSSDGSFQAMQFGLNGDVPQTGDFDGDGRSDISVFRPTNGVWYVLRSSDNAVEYTGWGLNGDVPVASNIIQ